MATSKSTSKRKARPGPAAKARKSVKAKSVPTSRKRKSEAAPKVERKSARKAKKSNVPLTADTVCAAPDPGIYHLPERFDSSTAATVLADIKARRGKVIVVDASNVRRVGAQPLQILVSAVRTWQSDGYGFSLLNPSNELIEAATLLGFPASELSISGQWQ